MPTQKPRVLVIDDDTQCLTVRRLFLEAFGFNVTTCLGAKAGLRSFHTGRYDAAIVDFQMPEMNGARVAGEMKRLRPGMPVVLVSALPWLPEDTPQTFDAFISKDESGFQVVTKLEELIAAAAAPQHSPNRKRLSSVGSLVAQHGAALVRRARTH